MASPSGTVRALLVAAVATGAAVAVGVVRHSPAPAPVAVSPLTTTLASLDTSTAVVRRAAFCDAVPSADIRAAADDASPSETTWSNGDRLGRTKDVAHEYGCSWSGATGTTAAGWVFAPPVTVQRARQLVDAARSAPGCTPLAGAAAFGSPGAALSCTAKGTTTISYRGLFGDAWLVCQLGGSAATDPATDPATDAAGVADRWCASVLVAAGAEPSDG